MTYPEDQTCCGQWAVNTGQTEAARAMARHFIRVFESAAAVVSPSGSCVLTVRNHYPELFGREKAWQRRAEALGERTFELTDYLVNHLGVTDLGAALEARVTFHDSCHPLRGLGLKHEPRMLLEKVRGLELVEMKEPETCCGFGGAFMARYAPLSKAIADEKIDQALETGADLLILTEPGCLLNVSSALKARETKLKAMHLVEVLSRTDGGLHA